MSVDEKKLREKMDMILDFMAQEKLISKETSEKMKDEQAGFIDQLVENLSNSGMEDKDIRNENFQNKVMGTIVSHTLGMAEAAKLGMDTLNNALKLKDENPENTLDKTLGNSEATQSLNSTQALHVVISNMLNNELPKPKPGAKQLTMEEFKEKLDKEFTGTEKEKKEVLQLAEGIEDKLKAQARRNAYAGDDPTITGEVQSVENGPILTYIADWFEPPADPNATSERVKEATENTPGNDPLGIKDKNKSVIDEAASILTPIMEMAGDELAHQDKLTPKLNHHQ